MRFAVRPAKSNVAHCGAVALRQWVHAVWNWFANLANESSLWAGLRLLCPLPSHHWTIPESSNRDATRTVTGRALARRGGL